MLRVTQHSTISWCIDNMSENHADWLYHARKPPFSHWQYIISKRMYFMMCKTFPTLLSIKSCYNCVMCQWEYFVGCVDHRTVPIEANIPTWRDHTDWLYHTRKHHFCHVDNMCGNQADWLYHTWKSALIMLKNAKSHSKFQCALNPSFSWISKHCSCIRNHAEKKQSCRRFQCASNPSFSWISKPYSFALNPYFSWISKHHSCIRNHTEITS